MGLLPVALSRTKEEGYQVFDFDPTKPVDAFTATSVHRWEVIGRHFHQEAAFHDALMAGDATAALNTDIIDTYCSQGMVSILSFQVRPEVT